jgi:hypothetical protein
MTSGYFQPLVAQNLALAATGIHCVRTEYESGLRATVMFSPDEYRGTFCASHVITSTSEATALNNYTSVCHFKPNPSPPYIATLQG